MLCHEVMKTELVTCRENDTVSECARLMKKYNVGFVPVLDAEAKLAGVVTDRDLVLRALAAAAPSTVPVYSVMSLGVKFCLPSEDLWSAEDKMAAARVSRLAVVDGQGHCVGVISLSDIAEAESRARAGQLLYSVTRRQTGGPAVSGVH
jgi:CBS domain-containing protein